MATRAQKVRLGVFLLIAGLFFGVTVITLVGSSLLDRRDEYWVRFDGSVSGLEKGAQVRYNGIRIGRVEALKIDPDNPSAVIATLSLEHETPITHDTVAVLNMQGITGMKFIELAGGSADSEQLEPGSEIPSAGSDIDLLTEKAFGIATKIEKLLDNLVAATSTEHVGQLTAVLEEAQGLLRSVRTTIDTRQDDLDQVVAKVNALLDELVAVANDTRGVVLAAKTTAERVGTWVDKRQVAHVLSAAEATLGELKQRVGPEELGAMLASTRVLADESTKLVRDADVTLLRTRDDLRRSLDDLATSTENIAEFTQILVDNPSVLISGRSERDRALP